MVYRLLARYEQIYPSPLVEYINITHERKLGLEQFTHYTQKWLENIEREREEQNRRERGIIQLEKSEEEARNHKGSRDFGGIALA